MSGKYIALLVSILLILPLISPILVAQSSTIPQDVLNKIDPSLYRYLTTDQLVEVVVRVKPLPSNIARAVSGRYALAVSSLKSWAEMTQRPVVSAISSLGGKVLNRFWLDNVILALVPGHAIPKIASMPDVVSVFRNFEVKVVEPVAKHQLDPKEYRPEQQVSSWGIFKIRAPEVWALGYTGSGVRIAVLDTGVDISHPALAGKMLTVIPGDPYYPGGWMAFDSAGNPVRTTPYDTHGHGTHCSGTALGGDTSDILIGVAPGATLMHGLVLPGGGGTFAQVLAGMQWTVEPFYLDPAGNKIYTGLPAHVVSMSFGATEYYGNELLPAIQAMLLANIVPVAAIGNSGPGFTSNPGNIWGVFGIGATDINDNVATWSSGKVISWPSPPATWPFFDTYPSTYVKPDFSAPGVGILSAVPGGGYASWSGTSMATPHVAGLVALMIQAAGWHIAPVADLPEKIYLILNSTSLDFGTPGQDTRYGWGRVDAFEAVKKAMEYAKKSGVEGYVVDEVTFEPVIWAEVTVVEANITVKVNATGGFRIPLDPGNYTLLVTAWGYQPVTVVVEVVILNGTIAGYVYNAITNTPVADAEVSVVELNLTTYIDVKGNFSVSVPPGKYTLIVTAPGYSPYTTTVDIDENQLVFLNIPLFPVGNGTIAGYVVHAVTGAPIQDAIVYTYVNGSMVHTFTDASGYYELNVPSGIYTVYAYKPGFIETNVTNVLVAPSAVTWVNISLRPIPPTVVVLANVHYYTRPHLRDIVASLGLPVTEYNNMTKLLGDWMSGVINPAVVIIDHTMPDRFVYPPASVVLSFHQWADAVGSSLIWLGTSYSGETGIDVLLRYNTTLVSASYPAPNSRIIGYTGPANVQVTMLNLTHPIFSNVTPDIPPNRFYLASGTYADYAIYNFTDPTGRLRILGYVNDTGFANIFGVGVAEWISNTGKPWYYLGSWAESYWMQYTEPGADGVYTNNTRKVLENAILLGWNSVVGSTGMINKDLMVTAKREFTRTRVVTGSGFRTHVYTQVIVQLPRQPHGYIYGRVVGSDGVVLANATVEVLNTPVRLRTNSTGHFYTWLPAGTYTIRITAPGYKPRVLTVAVQEGVLTNLGDVILPKTIRVAILYDYAEALKTFFESKGWYAVSYTNITQLTNDILMGLYDVVVYSGYFYVPYPTASEFQAFLNATISRKVHVIWMDSYGDYGYGIKVLRRFLNDPPVVSYSWGYPVYIRVTKPHPILRGYSVGQNVLIVSYEFADFSWFTGFSGEAIADTVAGEVLRGNAIAWKILPEGVRWVLLSSFAPTIWNTPAYFTSDAWNIIYNAVVWAASQPLNITIVEPYLRVGDVLVAYITGGPPLTELIISINGENVGNVTTDDYGNAIFTYQIPLTPGGLYILEAYSSDYIYYGYAEFYVVPKITVTPTVVRTPGMVYVEATGLKPLQLVHIYVDGNWLSLRRANKLGSFAILLNLPLLAEGTHYVSIVDPDTGEELASASIYVSNQLDTIEKIVADIRDKLFELEPVILNIDGNVATILTKIGLIQVDIDEIKQILLEHDAKLLSIIDNLAIIQTDVGVIRATLEAIQPIILSIHDMTYQIVVVLDTAIGEIKADLETIKMLIETSRDAILAKIDEGVATILLKIDESTVTILARLDELRPIIEEIHGNTVEILTVLGYVTADLEMIKTMLEDCHMVLAYVAETVAVIQTDVGVIKAKLEALEPIIIEIRDTLVVLHTQLGEIKADLEDIKLLIESAREAILTKIDEGIATILVSIENSTITILAKLDELKPIIEEIHGNTVEILTILGTLVADVEYIKSLLGEVANVVSFIAEGVVVIQTNVGYIMAKLDALEPLILEIHENTVTIQTQLGEIKADLEDIKLLIETAKEAILAKIEDGVATILVSIANSTIIILAKLDELKPIIEEIHGNTVEILTILGYVTADLETIKKMLEDCHMVLAYVAETVAVIQTDVGVIKAKLEALEPIIIEIRDTLVVLHTQLGEIQATLEDIIDLIVSSREIILTEIRSGFATLELMIANSTTTILMRLDDLASLINETRGIIIERIDRLSSLVNETGNTILARIDEAVAVIKLELAGVETRIIAKISALEPIISRIDENVVYIMTKLGEMETNITTILSALSELDAKIMQIKGDLVVIYTAIGELRVRLDLVLQNLALMNATIVTIMNDVAFIKTSAGQIIARLDDLVNALQSVNATITGIIVQSRDSILTEITTSRGTILADISAARALIERGLPISTSELRDILSSLIRDTSSQVQAKIDNVGSRVDKVSGGVDQSNTLNLVSLVLLIVVLALMAYQVSLIKKTRL